MTVGLRLPEVQLRLLGVLMWPVGGYVWLGSCGQVNPGPVGGHFWLDVLQWRLGAEGGHLRLVLVDKPDRWGRRLLGGSIYT